MGTVTYHFTQNGTTNPRFFPLPMAVYDVSTPYSLLSIDRIPIDSEGEAIAADLHSGNVYATFTAFAATEGIAFDISLGQAAIDDLQAAIDAAQQFFSLGIANTNFDATGYFTPANATLVVAAVPAPGSLLLVLGTGCSSC